jgi:hypothetical protein
MFDPPPEMKTAMFFFSLLLLLLLLATDDDDDAWVLVRRRCRRCAGARALLLSRLSTKRDAHLEEVDEVNWRSHRASGDDDWRASESAAEDMSLFSFSLSFARLV